MDTLVGYDQLPFPQNPKLDLARLRALCKSNAGLDAWEGLPPVAPASVPVFRNDAGDTFAMLPGVFDQPVYWIPGDSGTKKSLSAGFAPITQLRQLAKNSPPPRNQLQEGLMHSVQQHRAAIMSKSATAPADSDPSGQPQPGKPNEAPEPPSLMDHLRDEAGNIAAKTAATALGQVIDGVPLNPIAILEGFGGAAFGAVAAFFYGKLQPDPDDSTGKWAAFIVGPILGPKLFDGSFTHAFGATGPYCAPALRVGDVDDAGNAIITGFPSVKIEGKAAARVGDPVAKTGVAVKYGANTVMIGGQVAARVDKPANWGSRSATGSPFHQGAARTNIGGVVNWDPEKDPAADAPSIPDEILDMAKKVPTKDGLPPRYEGPHDPRDPVLPSEPGIYFDVEAGEYRVWDPFGRGWSASLTELSRLVDIDIFNIPFSSIFESDGNPTWLNQALDWAGLASQEEAGNWYAFGGMFDLGSPTFPGAGITSLWFIPDQLWGIDMSAYYIQHDWTFSPASSDYSGITGLIDHWIHSEWSAYLAGANSHSWYSFGQILQIIYSFSTTVAGFSDWLNAEANRARGTA